MSELTDRTAYSAKIRQVRFGWVIDLIHRPAGSLSWLALVETPEPWALTRRGAIRKAQRILARRRATANRLPIEVPDGD